jgi:peptidoglycan/LPS O-acetylase OafA/YrhL
MNALNIGWVDQTRSDGLTVPKAARLGLLIAQSFVALTATAGGIVLVVGALIPETATVLSPPGEYLANSPFDSYLVPGLVLALIIGGTHALAFVLEFRRIRWGMLAAAVAAFAVLIWIFVQMLFIPFSFLQALYFLLGLAEAGLVMLALGIAEIGPRRIRSREGHRSS